MAHLSKIVAGGKDSLRRYVATPFPTDQQLVQELDDFWRKSTIYDEDSGGQFSDPKFHVLEPDLNDRGFADITSPQKSVLYIVGHSNLGINYIGGAGERMDAIALTAWLTKRKPNGRLPLNLLAIKVWACFSGSNGFARDLQGCLAACGYNKLIVVGYNAATGGPVDVEGSDHKHVWTLTEDGKRDEKISRAKKQQAIFWGNG